MCGQGEDQRPGAVANRVPRDEVVDVDDVRVGRDLEHDAAADGRRRGSEVGHERDDGSSHRQAALTRTGWSATMPSRAATLPWLSANETSPNESSYSSDWPVGDLAERPLPRRRHHVLADRELDGAARLERPDRRLEVGRPTAQPDVAEAVDEDDRGLERPVGHGRLRESEVDEVLGSERRADVADRRAEREAGADRREDVAAVERRGDARQHQVAVLET
jgi:hypothetical protein